MSTADDARNLVRRARQTPWDQSMVPELEAMLHRLDAEVLGVSDATAQIAHGLLAPAAAPGSARLAVPVDGLGEVVERASRILGPARALTGLRALRALGRVGIEAKAVSDTVCRALEIVENLLDNDRLRESVAKALEARAELRAMEQDSTSLTEGFTS